MCGIFGLIQARPFSGAELLDMSRRLRHRGPDDEGFLVHSADSTALFAGDDTPEMVLKSGVGHAPLVHMTNNWRSSDGGVALGHRRLSIIDLSARGHQPMPYRERFWIAYNGEVYNYAQLREELSSLGHAFVSECDTEVILAAYAEWGTSCLSHFNGMWGFAILDEVEMSLFVARDRFGVKPVYYRVADGRFAFASEIKAFTALADWSSEANIPRLLDFLAWNLSDHTEETMFAGVKQLLPGHYFLIDARALARGDGWDRAETFRQRRWYELAKEILENSPETIDEFRLTLEDAVRLRLRADVPVGSCLSGGLDSSSIVCLMNALHSKAKISGMIKTFTSRSSDGKYDESGYAESVALAANSSAHYVTPDAGGLFDVLPKLSWHQDEPFTSTSIFAQWCVFESARKNGVTVMLDGQGADEALGGYRGFVGAYLSGLIRKGEFGSWISETGALKREIQFSRFRSLGYTLAYLRPGLISLLGRLDGRETGDRLWIGRNHRRIFENDPIRDLGGRSNSIQDMSIAQLTSTNLPRLLHWEDRNSMAFSIEARVPFLDYRLVELCLRLPDQEKLGGGLPKSILRRSMKGIVPQTVLDRRDKMGFVTAEPLWITRDLPDRFRTELASGVALLGDLIDPRLCRQFEDVLSGRRKCDGRFWRVISAGHWIKAFSVKLA